MGYTVGVKAFDRPADFDPQTDPIVRIQAGRLRRALHDYYSDNGTSDPIYIDLPKGGYVPTFQHNEDSRQLRSQDRSELAVDDPPGSNPVAKEISIAVLPLVPLTDSPEDAYTADGLTEELAIALNRFAELTVIGPLNNIRDQQVDPGQIGREYGATFLLQGTVRRQDAKIRISPTLKSSASGKKLWGETFEYDLDAVSLFEIEDQVTSQVVAIIADGYGLMFRELYPETHHKHITISAVTEAVLRWNRARNTLNPLDNQLATEAIRKALVEQPDSPLLIAMLAGSYYGDYILDFNMMVDTPDSGKQAESLAYRAVSLDPNLQIGRYELASVHAAYGRVEKCIEEVHKTVALNPNNASEITGCGFLLAVCGQWEDGLELIYKGMGLNPHYPSWYHFIPFLDYYRQKEYQLAWTEAKQFHIPGLFWHPLIRAAVLGQLGNRDEAQEHLQELLQIRPDLYTRGREIMKRLIVLDENVEMLWDGLQKAGLESNFS